MFPLFAHKRVERVAREFGVFESVTSIFERDERMKISQIHLKIGFLFRNLRLGDAKNDSRRTFRRISFTNMSFRDVVHRS